MFDPRRYDHSVSMATNLRRMEEEQRVFYDGVVREDKAVRALAEFEDRMVVKGKMAYVQMRMRDLMEKNQMEIYERRKALKALYDAELEAYRKSVRDSLPTEADKVRQLEEEYARVQEEIARKRNTTVAQQREKQWESNCDELRAAEELLRARGCKLSWDVQNAERKRAKLAEKAWEDAWAGQTQQEYQEYKASKEQERAQELKRFQENRAELEAQLSERERALAQQRAQEALEEEKLRAAREVSAQLADLDEQKAQEARRYNTQQLLLQMKLGELSKAKARQEAQSEGKDLIAQVEAEEREAARQEREAAEKLRAEQLLYLELLRARREKAEEDEREMDRLYQEASRERGDALYQAEVAQREKSRRLTEECQRENYRVGIQEKGANSEAEKREKAKELAQALRDLEEFEREKAEKLRVQYEQAKEFETFLEGQTKEARERREAEVEEDRAYMRQQKQAIEDDRRRIAERLGEVEGRIRDIDSVHFEDKERPRPKTQWYNMQSEVW